MKLSVLMVLAAVTGGVDEPALTCDQRLMILHENSVRLATRSFLFGHACARSGESVKVCSEQFLAATSSLP